MISKPLLKQSIKANGLIWLLVTVITAMMLGIIIIVLGSINSNDIRDSLKRNFIESEIESQLNAGAIEGYKSVYSEVEQIYPAAKTTYDQITSLTAVTIPMYEQFKQASHPTPKEATISMLLTNIDDKDKAIVTFIATNIIDEYELGHLANDELIYQFKSQLTINLMISNLGQDVDDSTRAVIEAISKQILDIYAENNNLTIENMQTISRLFIENSFYGNLGTVNEEGQKMLDSLGYETMYELLDAYDYTETSIKALITSGIIQYTSFINNGISDEEAIKEVTKSLLSQMPEQVAKSLSELGDLNINDLVIGTIFFKMAGLLLPIVYVITTANNLIAAQFDSVSMAYVLSTPTKRKKVTITQMVYLIGSLVLMYIIIGIVGIVATYFTKDGQFSISTKELILLDLGALATIIAISGICFLSSAWFNRSKNAMGIGGGISMFFLVSTILGLFGSQTIPEAIRIEAMNLFNYTTIITLFDANAVLEGNSYIWGLLILLSIAIVTYTIGIFKFDKKDLPL